MPGVVPAVCRPNLTCLSHLHWEEGHQDCATQQAGSLLSATGVSEEPRCAPTPALLTPGSQEDEGDGACRLSPGQAHGRRPEGRCKGASCSFRDHGHPGRGRNRAMTCESALRGTV